MSHTKQALALGFSVLAMDPTDARHQCWSSSNSKRGYQNDQPHVRRGKVLGWLHALVLAVCCPGDLRQIANVGSVN